MNDHTDGEIAAILNERGYRTGHSHAFDPISVKVVRDNYALKSRHDRLRERGLLTALEIADRFGVSDTTVYRWHMLFRTLFDDGFPGLFHAVAARISNIPLMHLVPV